jgi:hypothetical protein
LVLVIIVAAVVDVILVVAAVEIFLSCYYQ